MSALVREPCRTATYKPVSTYSDSIGGMPLHFPRVGLSVGEGDSTRKPTSGRVVSPHPMNTELGEVIVDLLVLPRILAAVESAAYGHGRAYRHGGDEFVLLVPNATLEVISSLVRQLKRAVEALTVDDTTFIPKLSAGVWITVPCSHLTANELVVRASEAKAQSKAAYITACALDADGAVIAEWRQLATTLVSIREWLAILPGPVTVAMEATLYWEWVVTQLHAAEIQTRVAHAFLYFF